MSPCDHLTGLKRAICDGTAEMSEARRARHLRRWVERGWIDPSVLDSLKGGSGTESQEHSYNKYNRSSDPNWVPPSKRTVPCTHQGEFLRQQECDTCSFKGQLREIHVCLKLGGECFLGTGGFRPPAKIAPCRHCDHYLKEGSDV
jgi:hypothetical protein